MTPDYRDGSVAVYIGDALTHLSKMPDESVQTCITSPPYWGLRDYGTDQQLGLELNPKDHIDALVAVFREVRRVLCKDGTLWLNYGDCYATNVTRQGRNLETRHLYSSRVSDRSTLRGNGHVGGGPKLHDDRAFRDKPFSTVSGDLKPKDLIGMAWRVAFALQSDGWWLRSDIIWSKSNAFPESVTDRPTRAHEYLFLLAKSKHYYYDADAIKEPSVSDHVTGHGYARPERITYLDANGPRGQKDGWIDVGGMRNKQDVWTISTHPYADSHFATFPEALIEPCILAGCPIQGTVLDPFAGSGTTLAVAKRLDRQAIGIDLDPRNLRMMINRLKATSSQIVINLASTEDAQ